MSPVIPGDATLQHWLDHIGSVHLSEIELGLERVRQVAHILDILQSDALVVTVAGTNGKGSVVACLEAIYQHSELKTGSYTSPHLHAFNERIRINGQPQSDQLIVDALAAVEAARGDISLSYFEFATLAALLVFKQQQVQLSILEVGLGGRLDAVNIIDPGISVITSIALDHQEWLGDNREAIALEKAGILRPGVALVCGDPNPPKSLLARARELECPLYCINHEFSLQPLAGGGGANLLWRGTGLNGEALSEEFSAELQVLPANAACALQVQTLLPQQLNGAQLQAALGSAAVAGRQELRRDRHSNRPVLLDVAHNPAAAQALAAKLASLPRSSAKSARVLLVMAVMADKDIQDMAHHLESHTDIWYIAQINTPRCMPVNEVAAGIRENGSKHPIKTYADVTSAYHEACADARDEDLVVVTGSFYTIAEVRELSLPQQLPL